MANKKKDENVNLTVEMAIEFLKENGFIHAKRVRVEDCVLADGKATFRLQGRHQEALILPSNTWRQTIPCRQR